MPSASGPPPGPGDAEFRPLGRHFVSVRGDTVWIRSHGGLNLEEMRELVAIAYGVADEYGYTLFLGDASNAGMVSPEARRYQGMRMKERLAPSHTALYGTNVIVRTLVSLTARAIELLTGKPAPVSFHKDEAAARERIDKERLILRSGPAQTLRP